MATIEDSINTYLLTQSSITAYVGSRIYCIDADQDETQDYIRYQMVIPSNEPYSFGDTNTAQPRFQFDVFSKSKANCLAIGNLLVTALNRFIGTLAVGTIVIFSTANGPMVTRDTSSEEWNGWYHGVVEWKPEYER